MPNDHETTIESIHQLIGWCLGHRNVFVNDVEYSQMLKELSHIETVIKDILDDILGPR